MTALAIQSLNFSTKLFEGLGVFFKNIYKSFVYARQMEANAKIVPFLRHEYKGMSDGEILAMLNNEALKQLKR